MSCAVARSLPGSLVGVGRWMGVAALALLGASLAFGVDVDPVASRGLKPSTLDQSLVAKAVARTDDILQGSGVRLAPAWAAKREKVVTRKSAKGSKADKAAKPNDLPVYLVDAGAKASTPVFVPQGCRCVFVDPAYLAAWIDFNSKGPGRLPLDKEYFLSLLLLHEAGHLKDGTSAAAFDKGEPSPLGIDAGKAKANERHADEFVASLLRRASQATQASKASIDANWVVIELSKLSWNMQDIHSLADFGAFAAGKPSVPFDEGYTHANLALRILTTTDLVHHTEASQQLLKAYDDARPPAAAPKPAEDGRK